MFVHYRKLFRIVSCMAISCLLFGFILNIKFITDTSINQFKRIRQSRLNGYTWRANLPEDPLTSTSSARLNRLKERKSKYISENKLKLIPNAMPVITDDSSRKVIDRLAMPDEPFSYMKDAKQLKDDTIEKINKEQAKMIEDEDKSKNFHIKLFNMYQKLSPKKEEKNKTAMYFDLSKKAKESGAIGPFVVTRKVSKSLQSIEPPIQEYGIISFIKDIMESFSETTIGKSHPSITPSEKATPVKVQRAVNTEVKKVNVTLSHAIATDELDLSTEHIEEIKLAVEQRNEDQDISNMNLYGPIGPSTTIIIVQVSGW